MDARMSDPVAFSEILKDHYNTLQNENSLKMKIRAQIKVDGALDSNVVEYLKVLVGELKIFSIFLKVVEAVTKKIDHIDESIKVGALKLLELMNNRELILRVVKVFRIRKVNDHLLKLIDAWKEEKEYKSACELIIFLKIKNDQYLHDVVFPMLPKNMDLVYSFVGGSKHMRKFLCHKLDELFKVNKDQYMGVIKKTVRKFRISYEEFPEYLIDSYKKNLEYTNALLLSGGISKKAWQEMVDVRVKDNVRLQIYTVNNLHFRGLHEHAMSLAIRYRLPMEIHEFRYVLPSQVVNIDSSGFLKLDINTKIVLIQNEDEFARSVDKIQNSELVAIDTEWQPQCLLPTPLALLQIGNSEAIYLFDIPTLMRVISKELFSNLSRDILMNDTILKLGFGVSKESQNMFNIFDADFNEMQNFIDIEEFVKWLRENIETFSTTKCPRHKGLSRLSMEFLGKPLDKREQISDWEHRPLREAQKIYAALDVYSLLKIYDAIKQRAEALHYDFEALKEAFSKGEWDPEKLRLPEVDTLCQ